MHQHDPSQTPTHEPEGTSPEHATEPVSEATGTARKPYARPRLTEHGRMPAKTLADAGSAPPSDRHVKEGFQAIDPRAILAAVATLPIERWSYKGESVRHLGPMAQDFAAAFGLGAGDRHIFTLDATGVALAAIQGLHARAQAQQARLEALERELMALRGESAALHAELTLREEAAAV
jgi:hypothetical protein